MKLTVFIKFAYKFIQSQFTGLSLNSYWKIFKYIGILVKEEMPNSKEVKPRRWKKLRQPMPGECESVSAYQQERYPT